MMSISYVKAVTVIHQLVHLLCLQVDDLQHKLKECQAEWELQLTVARQDTAQLKGLVRKLQVSYGWEPIWPFTTQWMNGRHT